MNNQAYFGFILNKEFYQLIVNDKPTSFYENLKPIVGRLPLKLTFSEMDEANLVLITEEITGEGNKPVASEPLGKLPDKLIEMFQLNKISKDPLSEKIGGSVNWQNSEEVTPINK